MLIICSRLFLRKFYFIGVNQVKEAGWTSCYQHHFVCISPSFS